MARTSRKINNTLQQDRVSSVKAALYVRLSNEDNGGRGTDSIHNQLELLLDSQGIIWKQEIIWRKSFLFWEYGLLR